ncbi:MAG: cupin domain-containing protein [Chloroflexi bacterium]|nr:MAG: cupin domain-containing protein [Chloroflexota bacterium]
MDIRSLAQKVNLDDVDSQLGDEYWSPIDVIYINDWVLRAAAIKGEYHWHTHKDDEFFMVYRGEITIETEKGLVELKEGECALVPKGMQHKPRSNERAVILMLEPQRLKSRGDE